MVSSEELHEVKAIINAQQHILSVIKDKIEYLEISYENNATQKSEIDSYR